MKIKLERSGGFAGITSSNEMETDELPLLLQNTVKEILNRKKLLLTEGLKRPKGSADYLNYKITIYDGSDYKVIECNEFSENENLKKLIAYIVRHSKKEQ